MKSAEAEDELAYLITISERLAPDEIQVDRELEAWMDGLSKTDLDELAAAYQRATPPASGHSRTSGRSTC